MSATTDGWTPERIRARAEALGPWFHNIELPGGITTAPDHFLGDYPRFKFETFADALPADLAEAGGPTYRQMLTADGLRDIASYADILGPHLGYVVDVDADGHLGGPTPLVAAAHAAGLQVMPYTFRPENHFLPRSLWQGEDPRSRSEDGAVAHIRALLVAGIDGFFTDDVVIGRRAVDAGSWSGDPR